MTDSELRHQEEEEEEEAMRCQGWGPPGRGN
jgi:hypothetical protein